MPSRLLRERASTLLWTQTTCPTSSKPSNLTRQTKVPSDKSTMRKETALLSEKWGRKDRNCSFNLIPSTNLWRRIMEICRYASNLQIFKPTSSTRLLLRGFLILIAYLPEDETPAMKDKFRSRNNFLQVRSKASLIGEPFLRAMNIKDKCWETNLTETVFFTDRERFCIADLLS